MKLKIREAKLSAAFLAAGLLIMFAGCLFPDEWFKIKLTLIVLGTAMALADLLWARFHFRCPHCGDAYIAPLWKAERFCPRCGQKIEWE